MPSRQICRAGSWSIHRLESAGGTRRWCSPRWLIISGREEARRIRKFLFDLRRPVMNLLRNRTAALATACVLLLGGVAGATLAWSTDQTEMLRNTFTLGDIGITLAETPTEDGDSNPDTNSYTMQPGGTITKDPVVTLAASGVDTWVFVKLEKSANFDQFLQFSMADGWTALDGANGVFWRTALKSDTAQTFGVIRDNAVAVRPDVTAALLNTLTESTRPTLAITAFAVQQPGVGSPSEAWVLVNGQSANP